MVTNPASETLFQFHTGSIKRPLLVYGGLEDTEFQFHTGSIKSGSIVDAAQRRLDVSIPYWFD